MKKEAINKKILLLAVILLMLHPIIELDYLAYPFLNSFGLPRLKTIIDLLLLPGILIIAFLAGSKKKKTTFILSIYVVVFVVYFFVHIKNASSLVEIMELPDNFRFTLKEEISYVLGLLLPLAYLYYFYQSDLSEKMLKIVCIVLSTTISIPIFISDLFKFGMSTYFGYTVNNIFSWFSLPYEAVGVNEPRRYACKFFFEEGNTIGIILIMVLPFIYYFFYREKKILLKSLLGIEIIIQSMAMLMLGTRVASYGTVLVPIVLLAVYLVLLLIKSEKLNFVFVFVLLIMSAVNALIIPYSPSYQNQLVNNNADNELLINDGLYAEQKILLKEKVDACEYEKYSEEWYDFYLDIFEENRWLLLATPEVYYTEYYSYQFDPEFWVKLMFDVKLEDRVDGRQIQKLFINYKTGNMSIYQRLFGFGYTTFMWGSILIEQDFVQQTYSFGYLGFILMILPLILQTVYIGVRMLCGYKKAYWSFVNVVTMMSVCMGLACAYVSGHTLDELSSYLFIALCSAFVLKAVSKKKEVEYEPNEN